MGKSQMSKGEPINQSTTHLSFSPIINFYQNVVELVIAWGWEDGKSMGSNFEFGENPILGKIIFDFWGKKTPKNARPFSHTPTFFICSRREAWELFFTSMIFLAVCSSFMFWAPGHFYH